MSRKESEYNPEQLISDVLMIYSIALLQQRPPAAETTAYHHLQNEITPVVPADVLTHIQKRIAMTSLSNTERVAAAYAFPLLHMNAISTALADWHIRITTETDDVPDIPLHLDQILNIIVQLISDALITTHIQKIGTSTYLSSSKYPILSELFRDAQYETAFLERISEAALSGQFTEVVRIIANEVILQKSQPNFHLSSPPQHTVIQTEAVYSAIQAEELQILMTALGAAIRRAAIGEPNKQLRDIEIFLRSYGIADPTVLEAVGTPVTEISNAPASSAQLAQIIGEPTHIVSLIKRNMRDRIRTDAQLNAVRRRQSDKPETDNTKRLPYDRSFPTPFSPIVLYADLFDSAINYCRTHGITTLGQLSRIDPLSHDYRHLHPRILNSLRTLYTKLSKYYTPVGTDSSTTVDKLPKFMQRIKRTLDRFPG